MADLSRSIAWGWIKISRWLPISCTILEAYLINSLRFSSLGPGSVSGIARRYFSYIWSSFCFFPPLRSLVPDYDFLKFNMINISLLRLSYFSEKKKTWNFRIQRWQGERNQENLTFVILYRAITITRATWTKLTIAIEWQESNNTFRELIVKHILLLRNEINNMDRNQPITTYRCDLLNSLKEARFPERSVSVLT